MHVGILFMTPRQLRSPKTLKLLQLITANNPRYNLSCNEVVDLQDYYTHLLILYRIFKQKSERFIKYLHILHIDDQLWLQQLYETIDSSTFNDQIKWIKNKGILQQVFDVVDKL